MSSMVPLQLLQSPIAAPEREEVGGLPPPPGAPGVFAQSPASPGVDSGAQRANQTMQLQIESQFAAGAADEIQKINRMEKEAKVLFGTVANEQAKTTGDMAGAILGLAENESQVAQRAAQARQERLDADQLHRTQIAIQRGEMQRQAKLRFEGLVGKMKEQARAQVDPNRFWSSRDLGQKAMITIGMILHDIGAGLSGSNRRGIDILNGLIERDIESQRQNLVAGQRMMEIEQFGYEGQRQFDAGTLETEEARRVALWEHAAEQMSIDAEMSSDPIRKQKAQIALGEFQLKVQEISERHLMNSVGVSMEASRTRMGWAEQAARMRLSALQGEAQKAPSDQIIKEYMAVRKAQEDIEKLEQLFVEASKGLPFVPARAEQLFPGTKADSYEQFREQFITRFVKAATGAQMTKYELERLTEQVPSNWTFDERGKLMIDHMRKGMDEAMSILNEAARLQGTPLPEYMPKASGSGFWGGIKGKTQ